MVGVHVTNVYYISCSTLKQVVKTVLSLGLLLNISETFSN